MKLPTQKTEIVTNLNMMNILIYGNPKVGKSTFCANIPNSLFCATEEGHHFLKIFKINITSWKDMSDLGIKLITDNHEYRCLVIDTVDILYKHCLIFSI